jgi:hypothetical protein
VRSYVDLPGLEEIVLEESYVLGVHAEPALLLFRMDFALTPRHPRYVPPPSGEVECFRRGTLRFSGVERLVWGGQGRPPARDATGEIDFGHIDSFTWGAEGFALAGDWGEIELRAATVEAAVEAT